jgi:hypothetical protein
MGLPKGLKLYAATSIRKIAHCDGDQEALSAMDVIQGVGKALSQRQIEVLVFSLVAYNINIKQKPGRI